MNRSTVLTISLAALALAAAAVPAVAGGDANLQFSLTVTEISAAGESAANQVTVLTRDEAGTKLLAGWRVPIPTTSQQASEDGAAITAYSYQDLGLILSIRGQLTQSGKIQARGSLEISDVDAEGGTAAAGSAPRVLTFSHQFDVLLASGVPVELARVPSPVGGSTVLAIVVERQ